MGVKITGNFSFVVLTKNLQNIYKSFISSTPLTMQLVPMPNFSKRTIGGPDLGTSRTHIFLTTKSRFSATTSSTASPIPP